mmetsp:Transcript_60405/g.168790  ORF Transcript_60405/g.168790 Transcript_60405/m.168790 type:complete len:88 (+) Transcript_60405:981-1244(+)
MSLLNHWVRVWKFLMTTPGRMWLYHTLALASQQFSLVSCSMSYWGAQPCLWPRRGTEWQLYRRTWASGDLQQRFFSNRGLMQCSDRL